MPICGIYKDGIGDRICKAEIEDTDVENKLSPR